jgi:cytochrome P450
MYSPATGCFPRVAKDDCKIKDLPIKKGTLITYLSIVNHFNEKYFKNPNVFRPERWENECDNIHPYALTGFSGGPRNCIGKHLALL